MKIYVSKRWLCGVNVRSTMRSERGFSCRRQVTNFFHSCASPSPRSPPCPLSSCSWGGFQVLSIRLGIASTPTSSTFYKIRDFSTRFSALKRSPFHTLVIFLKSILAHPFFCAFFGRATILAGLVSKKCFSLWLSCTKFVLTMVLGHDLNFLHLLRGMSPLANSWLRWITYLFLFLGHLLHFCTCTLVDIFNGSRAKSFHVF